MGKYIKLFNTRSQYESYTADTTNFILPNVSLCEDEPTTMHYHPVTPHHDYSQDYFTLEAIDECTFSFDCPSGGISLSTDGGETWTEEYGQTAITVSSGAKVLCKGSMVMGGGGESSSSSSSSEGGGGGFLTSSGRYNVEGNIFSLYYGDNFIGQISIVEGAFIKLFNNDTYIISAENLSLPATTLAYGCYANMFNGCTSLTTAPSLPATTLAYGCYANMFNGCSNLNYIKAMFTTTPSGNYMGNWVMGVASSGTFVKNSTATWAVSCGVDTYPCNWTVETASS